MLPEEKATLSRSRMLTALIAAASALLVAVVGALLTYVYSQRLHQREARLSRINKQLSELYGPMYATLEANRRAYEKFMEKYRGGSDRFLDSDSLPPPDDTQLAMWRLWVTTVFQPGNKRIYELIVTRADLLLDDHMPDCLLQFCAHASGWDASTARWTLGDLEEHASVLRHPRREIDEYVRSCFARLKADQAKLLVGRGSG